MTPPQPHTAQATAQRVDELLARFAAAGNPAAAGAAEDLVRALMDFYGTALARAVALLSGRSGNPLGALLDDEITAAVLVLHDLHPDETRARVERALRAADATGHEIAACDPATGTLRLRPADSGGCGCAGTASATRERVEAALSCFAPEITTVHLDTPAPGPAEPVLLQIAARPPGVAAR